MYSELVAHHELTQFFIGRLAPGLQDDDIVLELIMFLGNLAS